MSETQPIAIDWQHRTPGADMERAVLDVILAHRKSSVTENAVYAWFAKYPPGDPGHSPVPFTVTSAWLSTVIRGTFECTGWLLALSYEPNMRLSVESAIVAEDAPGWVAALYSGDPRQAGWDYAYGTDATMPGTALARALLHIRTRPDTFGRPGPDEPPPHAFVASEESPEYCAACAMHAGDHPKGAS